MQLSANRNPRFWTRNEIAVTWPRAPGPRPRAIATPEARLAHRVRAENAYVWMPVRTSSRESSERTLAGCRAGTGGAGVAALTDGGARGGCAAPLQGLERDGNRASLASARSVPHRHSELRWPRGRDQMLDADGAGALRRPRERQAFASRPTRASSRP